LHALPLARIARRMTIRFGPLTAEIIEPESEKFTAPLVLIHGLWERAATWRRFAGYLSHRGWRCIALQRRGDAGLDLAAHVGDLAAALATLEQLPVIVGHDLGALLAFQCADRARAVVGMAPLVGPPLAAPPAALVRAGTWFQRLRSTPLSPPGGRWRSAYPLRDAVEPAQIVREILAGAPLPVTPSRPTPSAVFAVEHDPVTPVAAAAALAERVGAELHRLPSTEHAALMATGWETHVAAMHRWIVQRLGVDLLALYEEAMSPE